MKRTQEGTIRSVNLFMERNFLLLSEFMLSVELYLCLTTCEDTTLIVFQLLSLPCLFFICLGQ